MAGVSPIRAKQLPEFEQSFSDMRGGGERVPIVSEGVRVGTFGCLQNVRGMVTSNRPVQGEYQHVHESLRFPQNLGT